MTSGWIAGAQTSAAWGYRWNTGSRRNVHIRDRSRTATPVSCGSTSTHPSSAWTPRTIGVVGGSAGGGLAAALALLARDRARIPVAFQLLVYPMIDDRMVTKSSRWDAPIWNPSANAFGWRSYLGDLFGTGDVPAYTAPSRAVDLSGLPVSYVCVGTLDGFLDEDIEYAQRLNHMGVPTDLHVYPGAPHGFVSAMPDTTVSARCWRDMTEWLSRQLNVER